MHRPPVSPALRLFLEALHPGDVVDGVVVRIETFGVLVDLDRAPASEVGFVAAPELTWKWVSSAHEVVSVGQRVRGEVLALDTEVRGQAVLSLCALQENPWTAWAARVGSIWTGPVVGNFVPLGVFVSLEDGVAGLLPYAELGPAGDQETIPLGEELTVRIASVEVSTRRIHLTLPE